ncbi:MAG: hypothetical protein JXA81_11690 [Sedimentisphaerales bacterium]|nr:hypothetical protein [Sedimentisphaerales bacterium]
MNPHFWPEIPKANFIQNWAVVSYGKSEVCKTNLDFSLNIPKPKFTICPFTHSLIYASTFYELRLSAGGLPKAEALAKEERTQIKRRKYVLFLVALRLHFNGSKFPLFEKPATP